MAIKTFTTGEVLTAADTNTYLANSGLVYVAGATFSNVGSFDATGFTTTYNAFRLVVQVGRHSGTGGVAVVGAFRDSSSAYANGYYGAGWRTNYLGGTAAVGTRNNAVDFEAGTVFDAVVDTGIFMDINGFNTTTRRANIVGSRYDYSDAAFVTFGYNNTNTGKSLELIRFSCATNVTGRWTLYGYRN